MNSKKGFQSEEPSQLMKACSKWVAVRNIGRAIDVLSKRLGLD
jgi:hypothetical protein